jgi:hypothetical protein
MRLPISKNKDADQEYDLFREIFVAFGPDRLGRCNGKEHGGPIPAYIFKTIEPLSDGGNRS